MAECMHIAFQWQFPDNERAAQMSNPLRAYTGEWPTVFITGQVEDCILSSVEAGSPDAKIMACADALLAWAHCMAGHKPPKKFSVGLVALANWAGLSMEDLGADNAHAVACAAIAARDAKKTSQQP